MACNAITYILLHGHYMALRRGGFADDDIIVCYYDIIFLLVLFII